MGGRGRVKRQQVETEDGWTVITHGLSNLSVDNGKKKGQGGRNNAQAGSMPTDIVQGLTAEKLLQDFQNRTRKWETTACAKHLVDVLAKTEKNVTDAVCIGIGSFSRDWEHRHRAMWQLVLFMGVVSYCELCSYPTDSSRLLTSHSTTVEHRGETLRARTCLYVSRPRLSLPPLRQRPRQRHSYTHHATILRLQPVRGLVSTPAYLFERQGSSAICRQRDSG